MRLMVKDINRVKNVLEKLYKNKKLFSALFFEERQINKKHLTDEQISVLKEINLILIKQNYISANFRVIKLRTRKYSAFIVTDKVSYKKSDQVMPLHPENQFIVDDMNVKTGDEVLEIGVGSGVNLIFSILAGAKKVTALDINKRTFEFTKFNAALNLSEKDQKKIDLILNKKYGFKDIFDPVKNKKFDYIVTNPPFEPTPPKSELLKDVLKKYLGSGIIHLNKLGMKYVDFTKRFIDLGFSKQKVNLMNQQAKRDKVTHLWLGMVHYNNQMKEVKIKISNKVYKNWDIPIKSDVPMGFKSNKSKLKFD